MEDFEKTEWYESDIRPEHDGLYEFEEHERFFQGAIAPEWRTKHWIVHWTNGVQQGKVVLDEPPCRWRGRITPPVDVLLEI